MKSKIQGFTLVEMIIILIIIGVFIAFLLPKWSGIQSRARDVERKGHIQQISSALASYKLNNNGIYPEGSGSLNITLQDLAPLYMRSLPTDPLGKDVSTIHGYQSVIGEYIYISLEYKKGYVLMSVNEGGGMSANWISNSSSNSLLGLSPGFIGDQEEVVTINKSLCSAVSNGPFGRKGNVCNAVLNKFEAKYIVAKK